jgi:hypothetical protein
LTFFGNLLSQFPANFFFYAPMLPFGTKNIKQEKDLMTDYVKNLFNCNLSLAKKFLDFGKVNNLFFNHGFQFHSSCKS